MLVISITITKVDSNSNSDSNKVWSYLMPAEMVLSLVFDYESKHIIRVIQRRWYKRKIIRQKVMQYLGTSRNHHNTKKFKTNKDVKIHRWIEKAMPPRWKANQSFRSKQKTNRNTQIVYHFLTLVKAKHVKILSHNVHCFIHI